MRLILTLLVRDEVDVVAAMIEHHLAAGVDHIIVTDNGSVDGTGDVLTAYRDAGVLDLIWEPANTYAQAEWVTRMAQQAAQDHAADWVINADADEFWWPRDGGRLSTLLEMIPGRYGTVSAPRENLVGVQGDERPWPERLHLRDLLSLHERGGRIGAKVCHRARADAQIAQGNHSLVAAELGDPWPASPITVLHVPDRSYGQFENKIRVGGASLANNPDLPTDSGWHWRADYERLQNGTLRSTWEDRQLTPSTALQHEASGRLVPDHRLRNRLVSLRSRAVRRDLLDEVLTGARSPGTVPAATAAPKVPPHRRWGRRTT